MNQSTGHVAPDRERHLADDFRIEEGAHRSPSAGEETHLAEFFVGCFAFGIPLVERTLRHRFLDPRSLESTVNEHILAARRLRAGRGIYHHVGIGSLRLQGCRPTPVDVSLLVRRDALLGEPCPVLGHVDVWPRCCRRGRCHWLRRLDIDARPNSSDIVEARLRRSPLCLFHALRPRQQIRSRRRRFRCGYRWCRFGGSLPNLDQLLPDVHSLRVFRSQPLPQKLVHLRVVGMHRVTPHRQPATYLFPRIAKQHGSRVHHPLLRDHAGAPLLLALPLEYLRRLLGRTRSRGRRLRRTR
jgi:hypothetical protein